MQLFVNCGSRISAVDVDAGASFSQIRASLGLDSSFQFCAGGRVVSDEDVISSQSSMVSVVCVLEGGAKKKKQNFTTEKKKRHRHRKVKLAVLKYYKVDASGNVQKTKKTCPQKSCGAGVFMAEHFNRFYCGKCSTTFAIQGAPKTQPPKAVVAEVVAAPVADAKPAKGKKGK